MVVVALASSTTLDLMVVVALASSTTLVLS
jgi:hypothetical protein